MHHLENQLVPLIRKRNQITKAQQRTSSLDLLTDYRIENMDEMVTLLRLSCARNLARAFIIENTVLPQ